MSRLLALGKAVLTWPFVGLVRLYQMTLGAIMPNRCRFSPSCSGYAVESLKLNGLIIGGGQAIWRLLRCGPWTAGGFDEPSKIRLFSQHARADRASTNQKLEIKQ